MDYALLDWESERAFDDYRSVVSLESAVLTEQESAGLATDRELLATARTAIGVLKSDPQKFHGIPGFDFIILLDDASRNTALCEAQAGLSAAIELQQGKAEHTSVKLHLMQSCKDASSLLYTVSETATSMYEGVLTQGASDLAALWEQWKQCTDILKQQKQQ